MGVDLRNSTGGAFRFSTIGWAFYLNLAAILYGWKKAGTRAPAQWNDSEGPWPGAYDWNAGQIVSADDAASFAAALERYLGDDRRNEKAVALAKDLSRYIGTEIQVTPNDADYIRSFVQFARGGEFEIW